MSVRQAVGSGDLGRISLTRVTSVLLLGRVAGVVFSLINAVVLARVLGLEALGQYAYAMGLVALFGLVPNSGLNTVITRAIALDPDHNGLLFSTAQRTQIWLGLGVFMTIMSVATMLPRRLVSMSDLALAGGQLVLGSLSIPYLAVLAGRARYDLAAIVEISVACLGTVSFLVVAALKGGLTAFLGAQIMNATGSIVIARLIARKYLPGSPGTPCSMSTLLRQSMPFGTAGIVQNLYARLDILLLGQLATPVMVGLYSAAYKPVNMLLSFGASASGTLFPYLVQESRAASSGSFERVFKLVMVLAPVMAFVIGGLSTAYRIAVRRRVRGCGRHVDDSCLVGGSQLVVYPDRDRTAGSRGRAYVDERIGRSSAVECRIESLGYSSLGWARRRGQYVDLRNLAPAREQRHDAPDVWDITVYSRCAGLCGGVDRRLLRLGGTARCRRRECHPWSPHRVWSNTLGIPSGNSGGYP